MKWVMFASLVLMINDHSTSISKVKLFDVANMDFIWDLLFQDIFWQCSSLRAQKATHLSVC